MRTFITDGHSTVLVSDINSVQSVAGDRCKICCFAGEIFFNVTLEQTNKALQKAITNAETAPMMGGAVVDARSCE
jgi:hypothetical protein